MFWRHRRVVTLNRYATDTDEELKIVADRCAEVKVGFKPRTVTTSTQSFGRMPPMRHLMSRNFSAPRSANAEKQIKTLTELGYDKMPICMAKTQYSFTDDQTKLGAPEGFTVTVRNVKVSAGAGFLVALTGEIMTMPGLPKVPAAEKIDVDSNGKITGLF